MKNIYNDYHETFKHQFEDGEISHGSKDEDSNRHGSKDEEANHGSKDEEDKSVKQHDPSKNELLENQYRYEPINDLLLVTVAVTPKGIFFFFF